MITRSKETELFDSIISYHNNNKYLDLMNAVVNNFDGYMTVSFLEYYASLGYNLNDYIDLMKKVY